MHGDIRDWLVDRDNRRPVQGKHGWGEAALWYTKTAGTQTPMDAAANDRRHGGTHSIPLLKDGVLGHSPCLANLHRKQVILRGTQQRN